MDAVGGWDPWEACADQTPVGPVGPLEKEPMLEQVWQNFCFQKETMLEQSVSEGLQPVERTHTAAICEELQPVGRMTVEEVNGRLSTGEGSHTGGRKECKGSSH